MNDVSLKTLFLKNPHIIQQSFVIYDEIDNMANPLTCELNFEHTYKNLSNGKLSLSVSSSR